MINANFLFDFNDELFTKPVWIVLHKENHGSVSFLKRKLHECKNLCVGLCTFEDELGGCEFEGEHVCMFRDVDRNNAHLVVAGKGWYFAYENTKSIFDESEIFLFMEGWYEENDTCIVCGKQGLFRKYAEVYPFITERMFHGKVHDTGLSYCLECGMTYSAYRPDDEDASLYYKNYRDENYQIRRQFYEPAYTAEFNAALSDPPDGGESRRRAISDFLRDAVDFESVRNILDYGGDRGQFIPDIFGNAQKYVYDISGVQTEKDVIGISNEESLCKCGISWDMILCNQCMEHLSDIAGYFHRLVDCMSEGTYLYIEVPNERSILNSYTVKIHEHINMFSEKAFLKLAEKYNLEVIKSTDESDVRCLMKKVLSN